MRSTPAGSGGSVGEENKTPGLGVPARCAEGRADAAPANPIRRSSVALGRAAQLAAAAGRCLNYAFVVRRPLLRYHSNRCRRFGVNHSLVDITLDTYLFIVHAALQ
jgi:hypothetical protein